MESLGGSKCRQLCHRFRGGGALAGRLINDGLGCGKGCYRLKLATICGIFGGPLGPRGGCCGVCCPHKGSFCGIKKSCGFF